MRTIVKIFVVVSLFVCSSCADDLTSLNENTKDATTTSGDMFFSNVLKELADDLGSTTYLANGTASARLFAQLVTSVTYVEGVTYLKDFSWTAQYRDMLKDLDESHRIISAQQPQIEAEIIQQANQLAMIEIMNVYIYEILVEAYGDIPYSEALDFENVQPKYDDDQVVYLDLISRLSAAINNLNPAGDGFGASDLVYGGNVSAWLKFANSMKLRMGMRIIDVEPTIGEQAVSEAVAGGVFTSNEDNARFVYLNDINNANPYYAFLVRQNLKYYVGTKPLVDYMNAFNDPRRGAYFIAINGEYKGAVSADVVPYTEYSSLSDRFREMTLPVLFLDYASVEFFLAEAAERGIAGVSDAELHYNNAIRASFDYYELSGVDEYLAQPAVNYSTAQGTWKEKIGVQKWIALFEQGFEAWTEYRRLDYPVLEAPAAAFADVVPRRFTYPIDEQSVNNVSYEAAAAAIGGDEYETRLFWDVN